MFSVFSHVLTVIVWSPKINRCNEKNLFVRHLLLMREKKDYFLWTHSGEPRVVKKWTSRLVAEKSLKENIFSSLLALLKSNQLRKTY